MKIPYVSGHRSDLTLLSTASHERKKTPAAMLFKEKTRRTKENLMLEYCLYGREEEGRTVSENYNCSISLPD